MLLIYLVRVQFYTQSAVRGPQSTVYVLYWLIGYCTLVFLRKIEGMCYDRVPDTCKFKGTTSNATYVTHTL